MKEILSGLQIPCMQEVQKRYVHPDDQNHAISPLIMVKLDYLNNFTRSTCNDVLSRRIQKG